MLDSVGNWVSDLERYQVRSRNSIVAEAEHLACQGPACKPEQNPKWRVGVWVYNPFNSLYKSSTTLIALKRDPIITLK